MSTPPKEILVVGFGAVGAIYSFVLKKSRKARVTVVARSNYDTLCEYGIEVESERYGFAEGWRPDRICQSVEQAANRAYDYVIITTKVIPEQFRTHELLAPLMTERYVSQFPQPTYVLMQNGMNIELDLYNALKDLHLPRIPHIISACVYVFALLKDRILLKHNTVDKILLGIYRETFDQLENTPEEEVILSGFGDILSAGGTEVHIVPEIQRVKFEKNMWNCVLGPVSVLSRETSQSVFRPPLEWNEDQKEAIFEEFIHDPRSNTERTPSQTAIEHLSAAFPIIKEYTVPFIYDAFVEVAEVGNMVFPPLPDGSLLFQPHEVAMKVLSMAAETASKPTAKERLSILVDLELGRPMEVEVLVGEVVRMARRVGASIPRLESFYAMMLITQCQLLHKSHSDDY